MYVLIISVVTFVSCSCLFCDCKVCVHTPALMFAFRLFHLHRELSRIFSERYFILLSFSLLRRGGSLSVLVVHCTQC